MSLIRQIGHAARQGARIAYYTGQYALTRRLMPADPPGAQDTAGPETALPDRSALRRAILDLWRRDMANLRDGVYPLPPALPGSPAEMWRVMRAYLNDLPDATARRQRKGHSDIMNDAGVQRDTARYPRYYLQNFHFQTDGWLSDKSARLYDHQVEVLFTGTADMMRRQAIPPLKAHLGGQRRPRPRIADIGSGTGAFLRMLARSLPQARLTGVEPSPAYRRHAAAQATRARFVDGFAESLPLSDASQDAVTCVYLYHELPPKIRRRAAAEAARVLRPGGLLVVADSLQPGDVPEFDGLLRRFPQRFHEPYYGSYLALDMDALFATAGLAPVCSDTAFLSKIFVYRKPKGL